MKREIRVLLICNTGEENRNSKFITQLEEFVPLPPSCGLNTLTICSTELNANVLATVLQPRPDLIIYYGLGQGLFWSEHTSVIEHPDGKIPLLYDNHDVQNLFYGEKYMYSTFFDIIKAKILEIDAIKSRPSKLYIARTMEDLKYIENRCHNEAFGLDTETNFLNPFIKDPEPKLLCYSVAWLSDEEEGWVVPTSQHLLDSGNCLFTVEQAKQNTIRALLESPQASFIHNAAYDLLVFFELFKGQMPKNFTACTMLLLNLFHYASKSAALKENTHLIGLPSYKEPVKEWIEAQPKTKGQSKKNLGFEDVPLDIIGPYAAMDAIAVIRLVNYLKKNMPKSLWQFYFKIPHKVLLTSIELACEGYTLSRDRFNFTKFALEKYIRDVYSDALDTVKDHVDQEFNIGSNKQLGELLFDEKKLNLPVFNKTKKGANSTGAKALDDLILFHPFIFQLFKLRKLQKLYSTYSYKGYAGVLNEGSRMYKKTGNWTMNAQYKQTNRTARLASSNFNQHDGIKKKGGNILTLPAQGSMVKHYFEPGVVAEAENVLYQHIFEALPEEGKKKLLDAEKYNIDIEIKPAKPESKKTKKDKAVDDDNSDSTSDESSE